MKTSITIVGDLNGIADCVSEIESLYTIRTVEQVSELKQLSVNTIELILLVIKDNFIEDISSIEKIKRNDKFAEIPILVVDNSPFTIPENIKLVFKSGIDDYIIASKCGVELVARVEKLIIASKRKKGMVAENDTLMETLSLMDKLILFMDKADNSFIVFNLDGEIEWVNEGFTRLYGYSLAEFKLKFGRTIFEASRNSNIESKINTCIETKRTINYVAECQTKSGSFKWIQTTFTPIIAPSGKIERYIAIETDITKLKETEEALNQKNEYMLALTNHLKSANLLLEEQQKEINAQNQAIAEEQKKSEELLLNILPYEVARQLKSKGVAKPRNYRQSTILFLDFVGFTGIAQELSPKDLVQALDSYFSEFDRIIEPHFIEKIKTIGDAYLCAGGLPLSNKSNPFDVVIAALEIQHFINRVENETKTNDGQIWNCRIGIHTGSVIAGVVGKSKYLYDIWGNAVNIAARMQQQGEKDRINISEETYNYIKDYFECESRGKVAIKNCDEVEMYFVNRLKPEYSADDIGIVPNDEFNRMLNSL